MYILEHQQPVCMRDVWHSEVIFYVQAAKLPRQSNAHFPQEVAGCWNKQFFLEKMF